jgi:hypothetical protein
MKAQTTKIRGQESWRIKSPEVEAFITGLGGHLGPVKFRLGSRTIQPYAVAPWATEALDAKTPPVLKVLRGDFFCLPFGGNDTPFRGERHPPHGETANAKWALRDHSAESIHLSLPTRIRRGRVDKFVSLKPGHTAVYIRHVVAGMSGPMSFGHHAMLKFPDPAGSGHVSTSRFVRGQVLPTQFECPAKQGYSSLKIGATFRELAKVPRADGENADLSRYPARRGFEDLVMLSSNARLPFTWTAVTFPGEGYVWFAIKDPRVLRHTVLWHSNGGRYYAPWSARHLNVLGLEEVTSYFHYGLAESAAANPVSGAGMPTCMKLDPSRKLCINYIMAVAAIPKRFDQLKAIKPVQDRTAVELESTTGRKVRVPLDLDFITRE